MLTLILSALVLQTAAAPAPQPASRPESPPTWTGCLQAGSAPATYRLNLDPPAGTAPETPATAADGTQGDPFVQLVNGKEKLDLTKHVGKRVRVTGRQLTAAEAELEAARRPQRQEANETAAGTGGTTQQHQRYVRIQAITPAGGKCR